MQVQVVVQLVEVEEVLWVTICASPPSWPPYAHGYYGTHRRSFAGYPAWAARTSPSTSITM